MLLKVGHLGQLSSAITSVEHLLQLSGAEFKVAIVLRVLTMSLFRLCYSSVACYNQNEKFLVAVITPHKISYTSNTVCITLETQVRESAIKQPKICLAECIYSCRFILFYFCQNATNGCFENLKSLVLFCSKLIKRKGTHRFTYGESNIN